MLSVLVHAARSFQRVALATPSALLCGLLAAANVTVARSAGERYRFVSLTAKMQYSLSQPSVLAPRCLQLSFGHSLKPVEGKEYASD